MRRLDALFLSYYEDVDRWHTDLAGAASRPTGARARAAPNAPRHRTLIERMARQSVEIDGHAYDFARFLSWARYGHAGEYRRYDAYSITHLSGAYFESLLARRGFCVQHLNHATRLDLEALAREVEPRYLCLSTTLLTETTTIADAIQHLRRLWPGVPVIAGGLVLVELEKVLDAPAFERLLRAFGADAYVVSPRGEHALLEILAHEPSDLAALALPATYVRVGSTYRRGEGVAEREESLDESWVRWDELDPRGLYPLVHMRTARSCAFACAFCSFFVNQGPLTLAQPQTLERELESLRRAGSVRGIVFTDDTFNVPRRRFDEILAVLARFDFEWHSFFRAQYADEDTVLRMRDSGCRSVVLGLESLDPRVLAAMDKHATRAEYEHGIRLLVRAGVSCHANFIAGFPGDRPENTRDAIRFCDDLDVDFYCVSPWYCSRATPVWNSRAEHGLEGAYWDWRHATMTSEEAFDLEEEAVLAGARSVFMSELTAQSAWSEVLLLANGLSRDEARLAAAVYNRLCGRASASAAVCSQADFLRLQGILARRPFPIPPGSERVRTTEGAPVS